MNVSAHAGRPWEVEDGGALNNDKQVRKDVSFLNENQSDSVSENRETP